jgi:hypothetical protein
MCPRCGKRMIQTAVSLHIDRETGKDEYEFSNREPTEVSDPHPTMVVAGDDPS